MSTPLQLGLLCGACLCAVAAVALYGFARADRTALGVAAVGLACVCAVGVTLA